jgi:membrane-associated phospholipid phosphatase
VLRRPGPPLLAALASLVALAVTGLMFHLWPAADRNEVLAMQGFVGLKRPRIDLLADHLAHLVDPGAYALFGLTLVVVAVARGRLRIAAAIPVVLIGAGATTEILKHVLTPRVSEWVGLGYPMQAGWPSGHATAAMALALCAVIAVPARLRRTTAALGGAFAIAIGYALMVLAWHFPADIVGGYFVAAAWALAAVGVLNALERRWPMETTARTADGAWDRLGPPAVAATGAGAAFAVFLLRPHDVVAYAMTNTTFVAGALAIAALALVLAGGVARGTRP